MSTTLICKEECLELAQYQGMCRLHYDRTRKNRHVPVDKKCQHCGGTFNSVQGKGKRKYCTECVPSGDKRAIQLMATYGLTISMFEAMYFDQDGKCEITNCSNEAVAVDHSHKCSNNHKHKNQGCLNCVRVLLCRGCNVRLSAIEDEFFLVSAAQYLEDYR